MLMRQVRNEREARSLMGERYSKKPKLQPGAFYVKRRAITVDDWEMLVTRVLVIFNLLLWGCLLAASFGSIR